MTLKNVIKTEYIPEYVLEVLRKIEKKDYEAYVVGGCVRDILLERTPKDWDIATNARPAVVQEIFPDSVYENQFGTVGVKIRRMNEQDEEEVEIVDITTYRIESKYSDKRHPDEVSFAETLQEDLGRRDFTINALAIKLTVDGLKVEDYFDGLADLKNGLIQAVGDANERFSEDALRMMRAIRFSVVLGFAITDKTLEAIEANAVNLGHISQERIRDEFVKIILSDYPALGIELLHATGLLKVILPEIESTVGVVQGRHHYWGPYSTVYKHLVASLAKCPSKKLDVRLAALFHDIGKPKSKAGEEEKATFYNHEYVGERMVRRILERMRFSRNIVERVALLVRNHMFYYNVDEVGEAGVRRVIHNVGLENIHDLIDVRIADRLGSGVPKAVPYKLRHFQFMVEKVSHDPISPKQLKLNGNELIEALNLEPGPKVGAILAALLSFVIDDPSLNEKEKLIKLAKTLAKDDIHEMRRKAEERIKNEQEKEEQRIRSNYKV